MVINNYNLPCQYHLGDLENILYLQPFDENISYHIDSSGQPYCDLISGTIYTIDCKSIQLTEESNFDGNRFNFKYTLSFTITEGLSSIYLEILDNLKYNKYRAIVKTKEGMYYLVNYEFPYQMSYSYTFGTTDDCSVTFECLQNIPTMKVTVFNNTKEPLIKKDCMYCHPIVSEFEIIENDNVSFSYSGNIISNVYVTSGKNWYKVTPLSKSFSHNISYSNNLNTDTVTFEIELSDYLTTFHYNLIEFIKNKYTVRYRTSHNNYIILDNLFPSFSLTTSEDNSSLNKIKITLKRTSGTEVKSINGELKDSIDSLKYKGAVTNGRNEYNDSRLVIDGKTLPTWECVSPNMAKRLILPEVLSNGDRTGYYYVLKGYENYYASISDKIKGTFDETTINKFDISLYIYTTECKDGGCLFSTTLNSNNYIIGKSNNKLSFSITAKNGWKINSKDSCLSFSKTSGRSENEVVTITSSCGVGNESNFSIKMCDYVYDYKLMIVDPTDCFILDDYYDNGELKTKTDCCKININSLAHTLEFNLSKDNVLISNVPSGLTTNLEGRKLTVYVPAITDTDDSKSRTFSNFKIESLDGGICIISFIQDKIYTTYKTEYDNYICSGTTKYYIKRLYSGTTSDELVPTDITEVDYDHFQLDSYDCKPDVYIKWVDTDDYYCEKNYGDTIWSASTTEYECENGDKYAVEYLMYYRDGSWKVTPEGTKRMGNVIEKNSVDCGATPERILRWTDTGLYSCESPKLYTLKVQEYSDDGGTTWVRTDVFSKVVISEDTVDCGGSGCTVTGETIHKWEDVKDEMYCEGETLRYKAYEFESCNSGITWEKTDNWSAGTIISQVSQSCKESGDTQYKWEADSAETVCRQGKVYKVEYLYKSTNGGITWTKTGDKRDGDLIEGRTCEDCDVEYKWIETKDLSKTICVGKDEHYAMYHYVSDDCWKTSKLIETDAPIAGSLYKENSEHCGYVETKWEYVNDVCGDDLPSNTEIIEFLTSSTTETYSNCEGYDYVTYEKTHYYSGWTEESMTEYTTKTFEKSRIVNSSICGWKDCSVSLTLQNGTTSSVTFDDCVIPEDAFRSEDTIVSAFISDEITSIGDGAFYYCSSLTSITIPDSVTSIGMYAFEYCKSLSSVTIPDSVTSIGQSVFMYCDNLKSVIIGSGLTTIDYELFAACKKLSYIKIPNTVKTIERRAFVDVPEYGFLDCSDEWFNNLSNTNKTNLGNVYNWRVGLKVIVTLKDGSISGINCVDGKVPNYVYQNNTDIVSAVIDNGITEIGTCSFEGCTSLTSVTIPNSVTKLGEYTFRNCTSLKSVNIPTGVTELYYTFYGCTSLTSITIPNNVTSIGSSTFGNCSSLTSVTIPDSVTTLGYGAFAGCSGLTDIIISSGVTSIEDYTFASCTNLTSVTIPDGVTSIGNNSFQKCYSLTSVTIPNSVTSIGYLAFYQCTSITSVTILDGVTSIGNMAFEGCVYMKDIYYNSTKSKWNKISKGSNWWAFQYGSGTIHCTDGCLNGLGEVITCPDSDSMNGGETGGGNVAD